VKTLAAFAAALGLALAPAGAAAQAAWGLGPIGNAASRQMPAQSRLAGGHRNVNYDGRWTYARIAYQSTNLFNLGGMFSGRGGRGGYDPKWDHDYPNADMNFPSILAAITNLRPRTDGTIALLADDPDLFKFPFAYLCEVGFWGPTDSEVLALRKYLTKGGFLIVDDFDGDQYFRNFVEQMRRIIPNAVPVPLTQSHPIFDAFYRIKSLDAFINPTPGGGGGGGQGRNGWDKPAFYGIFENNDPTRRMYAIVNHNYDVSELWKYSATGRFAVDETNEAYKLGINYVIYSLTR